MKEGSIQDKLAQRALAGLAGKLGETPLARKAIRYWWLSLPVGWAMYSQFRNRKKKGEADTFHLLQDFGALIGPIAAIVALNEVATKHEHNAFAGPVKDAQFTEVPKSE